jgi:hypothetical protein
MRTRFLLLVTLWIAGCGDGTFDPNGSSGGGGGGGGDGDQLYLGTTATATAAGTITVVVHHDGDSVPAVDAKITAEGGGGGAICEDPNNASGTCPSGEIVCGTVCCPSDHPFLCASNSLCYTGAEMAQFACGASCASCNGVDAPDNQSSGGDQTYYVTGTLDGGALSASGDGVSLDGTLDGDVLGGSFSGPDGAGSFSAADASDHDVARYCGTYSGGDSGTWNLQTGGGTASGSFAGSLAAGTLSGTASSSSVDLQFISDFASGTASGSISGGSVTGSWSGGGASGSWSGSTGACSGGSTVTSADDCCTKTARGLLCPIEGC